MKQPSLPNREDFFSYKFCKTHKKALLAKACPLLPCLQQVNKAEVIASLASCAGCLGLHYPP